jgi:hypothetical protein
MARRLAEMTNNEKQTRKCDFIEAPPDGVILDFGLKPSPIVVQLTRA